MGVGDYVCVTLRGGAPWGFTIAQGEGDTYRPLVVSKVEEDGCAFLAGIQESDHVVSINGEPCVDMTLLQAFALIDTSTDCLQLLLKRHSGTPSEDYDPDETSCGEREMSGDAVESTTLHILSPKHRSQSPRKLYISESQDEAYYGEMDSDTEIHKGPQPVSTQLHMHPSLVDQRVLESGNNKVSVFSPGDMVEFQVSLSKSTLDNTGCKSLGSACDTEEAPITTASHNAPSSAREPLSHHGVVLSSPSRHGQVEVILQGPAASGAGRGIQGMRGGVGGPKVSCGESHSEGAEGAREVHCEEIPRSFTVSFGIPSEEATETEEPGSDSEEDPDKPNRHRARHARLRRSESLSDKQVKEAKSKCKRIALLLKAAPPNPNNKGVLMFKKHRQRAKKYTLVSYGTGEEDPEYRSEEDEDEDGEEAHTVEFTLVPSKDTDSEPHFFTNANSAKGGLRINWDKGLLEIERNLNNQVEMECLPDTKGKGALMFAQRRQRMDEISAEHDELRRQGIPVEGLQEVQKKIEEHAYMQSAIEGHAYMDVSMHQQTQHQQQYQQFQEQKYYEQQQQHYQQQQQYQQQYQQQQYEQQHYQQQQMYQQQQQQQQQHQQEYHQEQQQFQQYSANVNGTLHHRTNEMQSSLSNRTAQPFSPENMAPTPYSPAMSGNNQESQGEQIASRDERISTPAIRTGILLDTRRKNAAKPMFTFKEAPKVSPNPALLNLLNRNNKKMGFESGPEEDYLSLGAEACNFLQSQRIKNKIPPPVAPKPMINPTAPPWTAQMEMTNQDMPQCAENSLITPAAAPPPEMTPAPELAPAPAPAPEPSTPSAPQEVPTSTATEEQHAWSAPTLESQQQSVQITAASVQMNSTLLSESSLAANWPTAQQQAQQQPSANSWHQGQAQLQEPLPSQSPPQPPWASHQPAPIQPQPQPPTNTWNPQIQQTWGQPQEHVQTQVPPPWVPAQEQPSSQPQVQPPWAHAQEQPHQQPMHPNFGQPQEQMQQPQAPWAPLSSRDSQPQSPWAQQPQQKTQVQPPWVQQASESQPQSPWVQPPQHQTPQQAWPQTQSPGQPQPPWVTAQPQQQQHAWTPQQAQAQGQPPWIQTNQAPPQPQPNLNPWAPVPPQAQPQQPWGKHPPEHSQQPMNAWASEQNQPQQQSPWVQPAPPQPAPQPNWQQPSVKTPPQPPPNWPPAQTQPPNSWAQPSQQTPVTTSIVNTRPSPKPWQPPQNRSPPPPPQRMSSFTLGQRTSSPINPMATVLNPSSAGSAFEMPTVKGKGADMFAKRQSRMEKFVVDSETVEANKASRTTSPVASLPTEWKYTPNALGRSYSLSPPARVPFTGQQSFSASASPKPSAFPPSAGQPPWLERGKKAPTPWEAASRHPLGLVDEAFTFQDFQQTLATSVNLAAQRKILPEPPADWKARVSYQTHKKTGSQTWSQSQNRGHSRAPLPSFVSPTKNSVSGHSGYRSLPRQWQPQRSVTEANLSSTDYKRPQGTHAYKSVYTSNPSWSWKQ